MSTKKCIDPKVLAILEEYENVDYNPIVNTREVSKWQTRVQNHKYKLPNHDLDFDMEYCTSSDHIENCTIVEALRLFLATSVLPEEEQQLDKYLVTFANKYKHDFSSKELCYLFAKSILFLNTSLHSPNVKPEEKLSLEDFVVFNKMIDNGKDLPRELIQDTFESVKAKPLQADLYQVFFAFFRQTWLHVRTTDVGWKLIWLTIKNGLMFGMENLDDSEPYIIMDLKDIYVRPHIQRICDKMNSSTDTEIHAKVTRSKLFEIYNELCGTFKVYKNGAEGNLDKYDTRIMKFRASSLQEKTQWIKMMNDTKKEMYHLNSKEIAEAKI